MSVKKFTVYGLLIALALVMSYIEAQIPAFFAVPGMKLGLTNVVVIFALYKMDYKSAIIINLVRIVLVGMMFGNGVSILYSLAGGLLSGLVMILLKKFTGLKMITVSVAGGISHNIGQIIVACILLNTEAVAYYLLILWITGIITGVLIGIISAEVVKRVKVSY